MVRRMMTKRMVRRQDIEQRIKELKAVRDQYYTDINQRIAAFNGAISELELLIADPVPPAPTSEQAT